MNEMNFGVVGSGFSGAVLSRELVMQLKCKVVVFEERLHIGGNCFTYRDENTGIMIHKYGPHIFHTDRKDIWDYINKFGNIECFINRVKAVLDKGIFSFPINLMTINQFFGKKFSPLEAKNFLESVAEKSVARANNFEEQALKSIGRDMYQAFFLGYTRKQWGCDPKELPASILMRLPVRFNYNDNYYNSKYQGIPGEGYTVLIQRILDHPGISIQLGKKVSAGVCQEFDHVFWTGPIDQFFKNCFGMLGYRTLVFERFEGEGDFQGNAVMNYPEIDVPFTRVHEHKHFFPWEKHDKTVYFKEYSKEARRHDILFYPKGRVRDVELLQKYKDLAARTKNVSFLGRLGTYRYLDMDQVIGEALDYSKNVIKHIKKGDRIPMFSLNERL